MLKNEAAWLRNALAALPDEALSPLLSIGSGTTETRNGHQPWIGADVFAPLEARRIAVIHHEHREGNGVDLVGDLTDAAFLADLAKSGARSVLCCNVLEHVREPATIAAALAAVVASGGVAVLSVPRAYPYHPDPLDTMFRPTPAELTALFPELVTLSSAEVECGTLVDYALSVGGKTTMVRNGLRVAGDRLRNRGPERTGAGAAVGARPAAAERPEAKPLHYLRRPTRVTCAVLQRPA